MISSVNLFSYYAILIFGSSLFRISVEAFVSPSAASASSHFQREQITRFDKPAILLLRLQMTSNNDDDSDDQDNISGSGDGDSSKNPSDLTWIQNAMESSVTPEPDGLVLVQSDQGISGFAVDPQRGFVVVLVGGDRATYTVVSPKDKKEVRSAEALCLVQLAGGMDLGTPILPPDILAKLVAEEIEDSSLSVVELRPRVDLVRVVVTTADEAPNIANPPPVVAPQPTPERDASIASQAPNILVAINKLPGLNGEATLEQVEEGLQIHADDSGKLDRDGFMALLETLRNNINAMEPSKVKFVLVVKVDDDDDNTQELQIPAPSAVVAVGLALRYKVELVVSEECQVEGFDVMEISSRFPAFRPIKQLLEDARIMDGFIPSQFSRATAPDNEDKM